MLWIVKAALLASPQASHLGQIIASLITLFIEEMKSRFN